MKTIRNLLMEKNIENEELRNRIDALDALVISLRGDLKVKNMQLESAEKKIAEYKGQKYYPDITCKDCKNFIEVKGHALGSSMYFCQLNNKCKERNNHKESEE